MDTAFERLFRCAGPPTPGVSRLTLFPPSTEVARALGGTAWPRRASVARDLGIPLPEGFPPPERRYDEVLLPLENGRALARVLLTAAAGAVRVGGTVLFAADNRHGARTFETDAAQLGAVETVYAGSGCRVIRLSPHPDLSPPADWPTPGEVREQTFDLAGHPHTHFTHPGVFSADGLDDGTRFLLEHTELPAAGGRVLDACCGSGAIARVVLNRCPAASVVAADDDMVAVLCARRTLAGTSATVVAADLTTPLPAGDFDLILCNPPFHQGGSVDRSFVGRFLPHAASSLTPSGRLLLIANRFLAYEAELGRHFTGVRRIAEDGRWRLWEARKKDSTSVGPASAAPAAAAPARPARGSR